MDQIFDKAERERIHAMIDNGMYPASLLHYIADLEEIAKTAKTYHDNSTPVNGMHLYDALKKVDWMQE